MQFFKVNFNMKKITTLAYIAFSSSLLSEALKMEAPSVSDQQRATFANPVNPSSPIPDANVEQESPGVASCTILTETELLKLELEELKKRHAE